MTQASNNHLVWIDLEMTGLDVMDNVIIEIATIITDTQLNVVAEGPVIAIYQPESELDKMDDWNVSHHNSSGLVNDVRTSRIDTRLAEKMTLDFVKQHVPAQMSPLCGNSIHLDRWFLKMHMPELIAHLHYRNIDVSTLKELSKRWAPNLNAKIEKKSAHRALADIHESIAELKFYRENLFKTF